MIEEHNICKVLSLETNKSQVISKWQLHCDGELREPGPRQVSLWCYQLMEGRPGGSQPRVGGGQCPDSILQKDV